jgi:hypothetical protein
MHVTVDLTCSPAAVTLVEPDDLTRFDVVVLGSADRGELDQALVGSSVGRTLDGDALVTVDAVRRLAAGLVAESWEADFAAMLDYARSRGWLTDDGREIQAHVEWR